VTSVDSFLSSVAVSSSWLSDAWLSSNGFTSACATSASSTIKMTYLTIKPAVRTNGTRHSVLSSSINHHGECLPLSALLKPLGSENDMRPLIKVSLNYYHRLWLPALLFYSLLRRLSLGYQVLGCRLMAFRLLAYLLLHVLLTRSPYLRSGLPGPL